MRQVDRIQREHAPIAGLGPYAADPALPAQSFFGMEIPAPDYCSMVRSEAEAAIWLASVLREEDPQRGFWN